MGCDVHAHLERKKRGSKEEKNFNYWVDKGDAEIDRDYELFALLADVRNDDSIKPISQPKGIPDEENYKDDFSAEFKAYLEYWAGDAHGISYLTLAELKSADLDQEFYDSSLILAKDLSGKITETCGSTTGPHLGEVGKRKIFGIWGRKSWDELLEKLESIKTENHTDDDVRLVFFFDN